MKRIFSHMKSLGDSVSRLKDSVAKVKIQLSTQMREVILVDNRLEFKNNIHEDCVWQSKVGCPIIIKNSTTLKIQLSVEYDLYAAPAAASIVLPRGGMLQHNEQLELMLPGIGGYVLRVSSIPGDQTTEGLLVTHVVVTGGIWTQLESALFSLQNLVLWPSLYFPYSGMKGEVQTHSESIRCFLQMLKDKIAFASIGLSCKDDCLETDVTSMIISALQWFLSALTILTLGRLLISFQSTRNTSVHPSSQETENYVSESGSLLIN